MVRILLGVCFALSFIGVESKANFGWEFRPFLRGSAKKELTITVGENDFTRAKSIEFTYLLNNGKFPYRARVQSTFSIGTGTAYITQPAWINNWYGQTKLEVSNRNNATLYYSAIYTDGIARWAKWPGTQAGFRMRAVVTAQGLNDPPKDAKPLNSPLR